MIRVAGGSLRGRKLHVHGETRPTQGKVRQALFNLIQGRIAGARVLDGFAGSGALGIEALSRGASRALLVEPSRAALAALRRNLSEMGLEEVAAIVPRRFEEAGPELRRQGPFDLVLLDPPYATPPGPLLARCLELGILAPDGFLVLETSIRHAVPAVPGLAITPRRYGDTVLLVTSAIEASPAGG